MDFQSTLFEAPASGLASFDVHLTKPVDVSVLYALLEREQVGRSGKA